MKEFRPSQGDMEGGKNEQLGTNTIAKAAVAGPRPSLRAAFLRIVCLHFQLPLGWSWNAEPTVREA